MRRSFPDRSHACPFACSPPQRTACSQSMPADFREVDMTFEFDPSLSSAVRQSGAARPASARRARSSLSEQQLALMHRYWMAANYLTVGQIYLLSNPLLRRPLAAADI